nr:hypothetical protein [uncultured bacterium]
MTDDARRSTFAASGTMLAAVVQGNLEAAKAFGLDTDALRRKAGLSDDMLSDPDGRIPVESYVSLWEAIHAAPRALSFGLWLGKSLSVGALGVVGYVMQHAPDVRAALYCLERFNGLLGDGVGPEITERGEHVVLHRVEPPRLARLSSLSIAAPLGTVTLLRELAGLGESEPLAVEAAFQHPPLPPEALAELEALLGCPLRFNEGEMRLVLPRSILDRAVVTPNGRLLAYLERHAEALQARVRSSASVAGQVREILTARLRQGEPDQGAVAQALALSERTLQRRLQEEGTSFADLLDEVRRDLARMYLADPKLAVFEVAFLLGYSEPSAFNRAFKRWTGQSPSEFRRSI